MESRIRRARDVSVVLLAIGLAGAQAADDGASPTFELQQPARQLEGVELEEDKGAGDEDKGIELPAVQQPAPSGLKESQPTTEGKDKLPAVQKKAPTQLKEGAPKPGLQRQDKLPAVQDRAPGTLEEQPKALDLKEQAPSRMRQTLPAPTQRRPLSGDAPPADPKAKVPGLEGSTTEGAGRRLEAPGGVRGGGFAPQSDVSSKLKETPAIAEWEGDIEIVDVSLRGPIDRDLDVRGSPPPGVFGREYAGVVRVENHGSRAIRVIPFYMHAGELTRATARMGGESFGGGVNLPLGETVSIPVVFDLARLSDSARTEAAAADRFSATLFLARTGASGSTLDQRILRDVNMSNHRVDVDFPVLKSYRVTAAIDRVRVNADCRGAPDDRDLQIEWFLSAQAGDGTGLNERRSFTLSDPDVGKTFAPHSTLAFSSVLSHQSLNIDLGVMHLRDDDGAVRGLAEASRRLEPLDWREADGRTIRVAARPYEGCEADHRAPVELEVTLNVERN